MCHFSAWTDLASPQVHFLGSPPILYLCSGSLRAPTSTSPMNFSSTWVLGLRIPQFNACKLMASCSLWIPNGWRPYLSLSCQMEHGCADSLITLFLQNTHICSSLKIQVIVWMNITNAILYVLQYGNRIDATKRVWYTLIFSYIQIEVSKCPKTSQKNF